MYIHDLTHLLLDVERRTGTEGSDTMMQVVYVCNPSLARWEDRGFLMSYRRLHYFLHPRVWTAFKDEMHPWKIWDNGHKLLHADPDNVPWDAPRYGARKIRAMQPDTFVVLPGNGAFYDIPVSDGEFDSTGLCWLRFDAATNAFTVCAVNKNIFGEHMSQDARLAPIDAQDTFALTYNAFLTDGTTRLLRRDMDVLETDDDRTVLYALPETDLVAAVHRRQVEKNCVLVGDTDWLLYGFSEDGDLRAHHQRTSAVVSAPCPVLRETVRLLGADQVHFSLGTPVLSYRPGHWLACGHVKLKSLKSLPPATDAPYASLTAFLRAVDWRRIYRHGKYIYLMFFFEFRQSEERMEISRLSPAFLPTTDASTHLPYLLAFPTGLTYGRNRDELFLSYGEGDVRCKVLGLNRDEMENLLTEHTDLCTTQPLPFRFLNVDEWNRKPRWFHYGYFFEWNCGDDMFLRVWQYLHAIARPSDEDWMPYLLKFRNEFHAAEVRPERRDVVLFGGGDIITKYFLDALAGDASRKHAIGVGIPHESYADACRAFATLLLRNARDVDMVRALVPATTRVHAFPDLGFLLPVLWPNARATCPFALDRRFGHVGVTLCRTFYQRSEGGRRDYAKLVVSLARVLRRFLMDHPNVHLHFLPFCLSPWKHYEDDRVLHVHVLQLLCVDMADRVSDVSRHVRYDMADYVRQSYQAIASMDAMVCSRFHAHVFSIATHTPFLSISCSRKCQELVREHQWEDYAVFLPQREDDDKPRALEDEADVAARLAAVWKDRDALRQRLQARFQEHVLPACERFVDFWRAFVTRERTDA